MTQERYLTADEAVAHIQDKHGLRLAKATLLTRVARGIGPKFVKFGRSKFFTAPLLDEWVLEETGEPVRTSREHAARRAAKEGVAVTALPAPRKRASRKGRGA